MSKDLSSSDRNGKKEYVAPRLTSFGSVRNLTGGSGGQGADGALGMTMMN